MAKVAPTADEIRELLRIRQLHPADRAKALDKLKSQTGQEVQESVKKSLAEQSKKAEKAGAETAELEKRLSQLRTQMQGLEVRSRMSPQDLRAALNGLFETYNFSPAEELVMMLKDPKHPYYIDNVHLRVKVLGDLQSYVMPKLKNTEIQGRVEHAHKITIMRIGDDGVVKKEEMRTAIPVESRVRTEASPIDVVPGEEQVKSE